MLIMMMMMMMMKAVIIIGATRIVTRSLKKNLETIPGKHSIDSLQKTAGSREVPGRNACDRRHTYRIIIIMWL